MIQHDTQLLQKLQKYGVTLNKQKCIYKVKKLEWLGYVLSEEGVQMSDKNISAIKNLPTPTNVSELRSVLGTLQHYSKFIPNFAALVEPLRALTREKVVHWNWTKIHQETFERLKNMLISPKVLAFYRPDLRTIVTCDASRKGLGAELSQVQPDGTIRPVAFASRSLTEAEKKYSTGELEALACIYAVERWDRYLAGSHFTLFTDHISLETLLQQSSHTGIRPLRLSRWAARLVHYSYDVKYKKGGTNIVADMLSRMPLSETDSGNIEDEAAVFMLLSENVDLPDYDSANQTSADILAKATKDDPDLSKVLEYVNNDWRINKKNIPEKLLTYYYMKDEIFIWNESCLGRGERTIIPLSLRTTILKKSHEKSHMGVVRLKQKLRSMVYWPNLDQDVEHFVRDCTVCASSDKTYRTIPAPLQPRKLPKGPWMDLGMDIVGPFQSAPTGYRFLVVLTDYYSKWPEVLPTSDVTSSIIIDFLQSKFVVWGLPYSITTDNGPQFISETFQQFCKKKEIHHIQTPVYHSQANGATERLNRTIKQLLQANILAGKTWKQSLRDILENFRSIPHATTGKSPYFLMTGREMRDSLSRLQPNQENIQHCKKIAQSVEETVQSRQKKMCHYWNTKHSAKKHTFKVGDKVKVKLPDKLHKMSSTFSEVKKIISVKGPICTLDDGKRWHVNRLVKYQCQTHDSFSCQEDFDTDGQTTSKAYIPTSSKIREPRITRGVKPSRFKDFVMDKP